MGLFDDLLGKASELTDMGQNAADAAGQAAEDITSQAGDIQGQVEEQVASVTEQLPQDPTEVANQIFGDNQK